MCYLPVYIMKIQTELLLLVGYKFNRASGVQTGGSQIYTKSMCAWDGKQLKVAYIVQSLDKHIAYDVRK